MTQDNSKQRLFEVMGKVNNDFNNGLNEVFGWSKKEKETKARNQEIEAAKQEAQEYNFRRWMFQPGGQKNFEEGKRVRINGVSQELSKINALMPELFDTNQGAVQINSEYDIPTYVPTKWANIILDNNRYISDEVAVQNLTNMLDKLTQQNGLNENSNIENILTSRIKTAIAEVDPNLSVYDFANSIGEILIADYGSHNYEQFTSTLNKKLGGGTSDEINELSDFPKPKYGIHGNDLGIDWDNINDTYKPIIEWAVDNIMTNLDDTTLNNILKNGANTSFHNMIQNKLGELTKNFINDVDDTTLANLYQNNDTNSLYNLFVTNTLESFDSAGQGEMERRLKV